MRKPIYYIIAFVIICIISDAAIKNSLGKEIDNQSPYCLSFASIGANLLESRLDCWAKIKTASTKQELDEALIAILYHLKLPADETRIIHEETEDIIISHYDLSIDGHYYEFILQTSKTDQKSHLLMTAISSAGDQNLRTTEEKLKEILACKSYYQYKGSINTYVDNDSKEELLRVVMKCLQAKTKDVYNLGESVSMTGFSAAFKQKNEPIMAGGTLCNVQGAIRGNPKDNSSEIYLGFPLLLNDY
ncbi:MAG: YwmB family TATA-box binding protein [Syntrophomonas sp.]|nr:YwmB family TATA-box binding protein [Syntrophomonas sp.]